jgi:Zn-dependent metalloprotease
MGRWEYFVDAKTGEVIFKANRIMSDSQADDIGTGFGVLGAARNHIDTDFDGGQYRMLDYTRLVSNNPHGHGGDMPDGSYIQTNIAGSSLPGVIATDADNIWDDPNVQRPAVDGHVYSALVYDWLLSTFGRNGFDDLGSPMLTSVNYYAEGNNNAYWNGSQIVVWSWSAGARSLAGCPDMIAHEWGHAVTDYTSDLIYQKESGALNESFSDMMGTAFEFAHDSMDVPDWQIGENISAGSFGFRSMMNPPFAGDPDYYGPTDPNWVDVENCIPSGYNDQCGVHTNSGVGNKWFYLLSDGGTHHSVTVNGIGIEDAMQIAYQANSYYWSRFSDYPDAAYGTIVAANDLDLTGVWADEVLLAWNAVGVPIPGPALVLDYPETIPDMFPYDTMPTLELSVQGVYGGVQVTGSGQMHYSIDGGAYAAISMTETSPGTYEVVMPQVDCGSVIEFYFSVEETVSGTYYTPDPGTPHRAYPYIEAVAIMEDDLSSDPGWSTESQWAYGQPTGGGGAYGGPDPTSGYTGNNVYGYNLSGDYPNSMGERHLTSSAIDCSDMVNCRLRFQRWLGVEQAAFDHAYVRASNDGSVWTTVWENLTEIADDSWVPMDVNISEVADSQSTVYLRWTMGTSDGGWTYCGWNIDDIQVVSMECVLWMCGDLNDDGAVTLSDITRMIDYVYISKIPPDPFEAANVNGSTDGKVTLSDIAEMIDHVFIAKEPLHCL